MPIIYVIILLVLAAVWALAFLVDNEEALFFAVSATVILAVVAGFAALIRSDSADQRRVLDRRDAAISQAQNFCRPNRSIAYDVQSENTIVFACVKDGQNGPLQILKYYPR